MGEYEDDFDASLSGGHSHSHSRSYSHNDNISGNAVQLIRSIMGEPQRVKVRLSTGYIAYCPQVPAMHSGSIRSNILMGAPLEHARYMKVLAGCCLLQDLQVCVVVYIYSLSALRISVFIFYNTIIVFV